jgi:predicted nucleic acid-binding protein
MSWGELFERARAVETTAAAVGEALTRRRERPRTTDDGEASDDPPETATPTRVVADADVLAADLLVGGPARAAVDAVREHSWLDLLASEPLLADARAVIATLGGTADRDTDTLAADWLARAREECVPVRQPAGDHPGLATAYRGGAAHLLTLDTTLTSARAGLSVQPYAALSTRHPAAFAAVFDAAALYEAEVGGDYPGPDRDPRA